MAVEYDTYMYNIIHEVIYTSMYMYMYIHVQYMNAICGLHIHDLWLIKPTSKVLQRSDYGPIMKNNAYSYTLHGHVLS